MVSSSSVLNTRLPLNAFCRPLVTVYTPPFCATSSPNSSVSGYLQNRSCSALLIWMARCLGGSFSGSLSSLPKAATRLSCGAVRAASAATASGVYGASGAITCSSVAMRGRRSASSAAAKQRARVASYNPNSASFVSSPDSSAIAAERSSGSVASTAHNSSSGRHSISKSVPAWPMIRVVRRCRKVGRRVRRQCSTAACTWP